MDKFSFGFKRTKFKESEIYVLFINLLASSKLIWSLYATNLVKVLQAKI